MHFEDPRIKLSITRVMPFVKVNVYNFIVQGIQIACLFEKIIDTLIFSYILGIQVSMKKVYN